MHVSVLPLGRFQYIHTVVYASLSIKHSSFILTTFTTILLYTSPQLCCTFLQVSEIRDVLTARTIALMQLDFERKGLIPKNPANNKVE